MTDAAAERGRQAGTGLIEVMVALLCTSLLAAGVLALVGDAAWLCRQQRAGIEARQQALVAADIVARELAAAGARLEGARAVDWRGEVVPVIEPRADGLAVIAGSGAAVEVEPLIAGDLGGARRSYRAATMRPPGARRDRVGLEADERVVGVGLVDEEGLPASVLPAGTVREVAVDAGRGRVVIDWDRAPPTPVRALVPVRRRELGLRPDAGAGIDGMWQLRRRDDDGRWQPMVDAIAELVIRMRGTPAAGAAGGAEAAAAAEVTVRTRVPSGATGVTRRRVLLRVPS